MEKICALLLSSLTLISTAACSAGNSNVSSSSTAPNITESSQSTVSDTSDSSKTTSSDSSETTVDDSKITADDENAKKAMKEIINDFAFEGVIYAAKNGKPVASYAKGTLENGEEITLDTPMPLGSVSKQFCAAAILLLQERGKLSINDTLDKYFPEYKDGKKITLKNLLSMRSGITDILTDQIADVNKTDEENTASIKKWVFENDLRFEPDEMFEYANANYTLLGNIVEQVSGKKYIDFLRENFFEPLGMKHTGSIGELPSSPKWANGISYKKVDTQPGLTKGAGDLISTGADMTLWMESLYNGKIISKESYKQMTSNYSPQENYGFGFYIDTGGNPWHGGLIGIYSAYDYINQDNGFTLFVSCNNLDPFKTVTMASRLHTELT